MTNITETRTQLIKQRTSGVETRQEELSRLDGMISACTKLQSGCSGEQLRTEKEIAEMILSRSNSKDFWTEGYLYVLKNFGGAQ